jgi:hypothetical protein
MPILKSSKKLVFTPLPFGLVRLHWSLVELLHMSPKEPSQAKGRPLDQTQKKQDSPRRISPTTRT